MGTDQISFYDEALKKQIEGSFTSDGKEIHVSSAYGTKSFRKAIAVGAAGAVPVLILERVCYTPREY